MMEYNIDRSAKFLLTAILIIAPFAFAAVSFSDSTVVFTIDAPDAGEVFVVGDFNDWSMSATPMTSDGGVWRVELQLAPRRYEYKFLVDGEWTVDPDNPDRNPDPYGGENSVVKVPIRGEPIAPPDADADYIIPVESALIESKVILEYPNPDANAVFVAGDFNDWSIEATPMTGKSGVWRVELELTPGKYGYKFYVDGEWKIDPANSALIDDGYGGSNSVLIVTKESAKIEETPRIQSEPKPVIETSDGKILFKYQNPSARQVFIAGDFNSWSPTANPLESDGAGNWSVSMPMQEGEYGYKFIVDGSWQPDPENPETKSDGYGGVNSLVKVDKNGERIEASGGETRTERVSNTFANSRVYIGGKYTGIAESRWNRDGDGRFRLDNPRHRMEAYLRVKISDEVTAWGGLSFDTKDADRIYEAALAMDSAAVELKTQRFRGQIYYNRPVGGLDDPIDIIGGSAVAGSPELSLPFGLGTGGLMLEGDLFGATLTGIYADRNHSSAAEVPIGSLLDDIVRPGYGIFAEELVSPSPNPDAYTEYSIDILGARVSHPFGPFELGASMRLDSGTWWYSITDLDLPALDDWIDSTGSTSDWFVVGKSELLYGGDIKLKLASIDLWIEYLEYDYSGGVVAGNKENDAHDGNGPVDIEIGARKGHLGGGGISTMLFEAIRLGANYSSLVYSAPDEVGFYLQPSPSTDGDGRIDMTYYALAPETTSTWWEGFDAQLGLIKYFPLTVHAGLEKLDDSFSGTRRDVIKYGFAANGSFLWDFLFYDIYGDWASAEFPDGARQSEFLSKYALSVALADDWYIGLDAVYHSIKNSGVPDSMLYDEASTPIFTYVQYSPVENVRMQIYWGVHPAMANGWLAGRREFIDDYIRETGATFAEAWEQLEDIRQIGFRGEIDF